jgi:hypothetical protein
MPTSLCGWHSWARLAFGVALAAYPGFAIVLDALHECLKLFLTTVWTLEDSSMAHTRFEVRLNQRLAVDFDRVPQETGADAC